MAGFDLSALLTGLSRGMGNYSNIQFAEKLEQEAEQRRFAQQDKLQDRRFSQEKELRLLLDRLVGDREIEGEQRGLQDQLGQAMAQAGMTRDYNPAMPREDMNAYIGEMMAASEAKAGAAAERASAMQPMTPQEEATLAKTKQQTATSGALEERYKTVNPAQGGTGQDGVASDSQRLQIAKAQETLRMKLKSLRVELTRDLKGIMTPGQREGIEDELLGLSDDKIEEQVQALGERLGGAVGSVGSGGVPGGGLRSIIEDEASKGQ